VLTDHIALVSLTSNISMRDLLQAGAAVQKQLTRDFLPIWGLRATLDTFADLSSVPSDYHPVVLFGDADELVGQVEAALGTQIAAQLIDDFERDRLDGLHLNAFTRQPFSLVEANDSWTVTLSHEVLEMIADPYGNRLIAAPHPLDPVERVKYLVEVCDPCQTVWYPINGVPVSDFYTPRYFDPVGPDAGRYSFTGEVTRPIEILDGGYLSWIDPDDSGLYQLVGCEATPTRLAGLAELARSTAALRTIVDTNPRRPQLSWQTLRPATTAVSAEAAYDAVNQASRGSAVRTAEAVVSLATGAG
jgi:hypothetical protein